MRHADYEIVRITPEAILLIDLDLGHRSVTNDAESVVEAVLQEHGAHRIVYRDTMGRWDELCHNGSRFIGFGAWTGPVPDHGRQEAI